MATVPIPESIWRRFGMAEAPRLGVSLYNINLPVNASYGSKSAFWTAATSGLHPTADAWTSFEPGSIGPEDLYGAIGVKRFRYWPSPCSAGLR
ncbi:hypothetical protein, partial [Bradyrhizobium sp. UFLA05-112]